MRLGTALLSAAFLLPLPMAAQVTDYTYTGNEFNYFPTSGEPQVFTGSDFVSVEFTLSAPLADNLTGLNYIYPTSFTVSDGYQTFSSSTPGVTGSFQVDTNANGNITEWFIAASTDVDGVFDQAYTQCTSSQNCDGSQDLGEYDDYQIDYYPYYAEGSVSHDPGKWSVPENPSPLYILMSAAALALGFRLRGRLAQSPQPSMQTS
jgi:hypothetical protein